MSAPKPITIIGGGLAGLTLGIGLRQKGIPVTILEAGRYPRHRVCGEFISGRGQDVLARLGLRDVFLQAGSMPARTAAFFMGKTGSPVRALPVAALCLSRYTMDALLAKVFRHLGGDLRENERWREEDSGEGVVRASGRRLEPSGDGWQWFGLKVHARNVRLVADLEMHGTHNGYVGMCRLQNGDVNVCGLFRRPAQRSAGSQPVVSPASSRQGVGGRPENPQPSSLETPATDSAASWQKLLQGRPGTTLRARMAEAEIDQASFRSVAGLSLQPQRAMARSDCCIGDALTMIPPVTGNGMSMAFEAAELAVEPLAACSKGEMTWTQARCAVACACDDAFAQRLSWARWLQWMMFTPVLRTAVGSLALNSDWLWHTMFARTR